MKYRPRDVSGSNFLSKEGIYHLLINSVNEQVTKKSGQLMSGVLCDLEMKVLAGTTEGQVDKQHRERVWEPDLNVDWQVNAFDRLLLAVGIITPDDVGQDIDIDWNKAVGSQVITKLTLDQKTQKYLSVHFGDIWHVDDQERPDCPINEAALKMMLPEKRRIHPVSQPSSTSDLDNI